MSLSLMRATLCSPIATDGTTRNAIPPTYPKPGCGNATAAATVPGGIYLPVNQSDDWS
jgi:hypothetical protein